MLGSTGERVHLDEREYLEVIEAAREEVARAKTNLPSLSAPASRAREELSTKSGEWPRRPVDAFLVITPHFYRPSITQPALIEHYERVADESPAPVILYSMPALTGIKIEPETAARLSEHENIIGIKDSSADVEGLKND